MDIVIDFDGTCVTNEYPSIGDEIGATPILRELVRSGHRLILLTMRSKANTTLTQKNYPSNSSDVEDPLSQAIMWFDARKIPLYGVNRNPGQEKWSNSRKVFGHLYIDDAGFGVPLVVGSHKKPYVDWREVRRALVINGTITPIRS